MKIKIKASCVGKDGEHLEQGSVLPDYDDETAVKLIRLGRAESAEEGEPDAGGDAATDAEELLKKTKDELLELAELEEAEVKPSATKAQIVEAILLKRSEAA